MSSGSASTSRGEEGPGWVLWSEAEPSRLERDRAEMQQFAPDVVYQDPNPDTGAMFRHGGWSGELPRWPFQRPEPVGFDELIGDHGLLFVLEYSAAHPMLPPTIYPVRPEPEVEEQTQATWHVAPGGSLCLLQSDGAWRPEASITELLLKASGWRVEYALMKAGVIDRMTVNGIVSDSTSDHLIAKAVTRGTDGSTQRGEERENDVPQ
ncbi:hypothetical protein FOJ82_00355 [Tessaracoccus rhinocerotis]|uniref:Uncharacterized protein n=2 Tax=Tessaracoccus rhinocerotis TaxID=1689449 RepID=A0A553K3Y7_9ACTN|nr:hypothetical protein FOJ82_00355 [Tessaracoccus rhinocerotis]